MTYHIWHTIYEIWQSMIYEEYDEEKTIIVRQDDLTVNPIGSPSYSCSGFIPLSLLAWASKGASSCWSRPIVSAEMEPFQIKKFCTHFLFKNYSTLKGSFDIFNIFSLNWWMLFCYLPKKGPCDPGSKITMWSQDLFAAGHEPLKPSEGIDPLEASVVEVDPHRRSTGFGDTSQVF